MPGQFNLDKWYLDAVREDGSGVILYDASVRWRFIRLHYYNRLEFDNTGKTNNAVSLRKKLVINSDANSIKADDGTLRAAWNAIQPGFTVDLLKTEEGSIRWSCHYPNCGVQLDSTGKNESARGYAEQLSMSLDPWKFNIDELYWGRFCHATESIVWIEWRGEIARKWLFWNGKPITNFELSDDALNCDQFTLDLSNKKIIRTGSLLSTVFKSFRWLRFIFPGKTIFSDETKWCALAELKINGVSFKGYSIFEKVLWMK